MHWTNAPDKIRRIASGKLNDWRFTLVIYRKALSITITDLKHVSWARVGKLAQRVYYDRRQESAERGGDAAKSVEEERSHSTGIHDRR